MKYSFVLFIFLIHTSWILQPDKNLPLFQVTYISGCAAITKSKINVYQKDNKYYADHTLPTYFDGKKIDSLWTVELNTEQINACIKFIKKAKSLPTKCERFSSSENHHIIVIDNVKYDINGDCAWDNLDFHYLDKQLFLPKHSDIKDRKKTFLNDLDKKLYGKWYLQSLKKQVNRDDVITFSRNKITDSYLEFGNNNSVTGNCNKLLNIKDLKRYTTEISDGWNETVVTLSWGKITLVESYNTWYENGAILTLNQINKDELKLNFLWLSD